MHAHYLPFVILVVVIALVIAGLIVWLVRRHRNVHRHLERALRRIAVSEMRDVVIPDSMGGHLHIDRLLLTGQGALAVIFKNATGTVFAGERLDEWAVMQSHKRFPFANPLGALQDRIAAVQALAPSLPVDGRVVFSNTSQFPKGRPKQVILLHELETWPAATADSPSYESDWKRLQEQADSIGAIIYPRHRKRRH